MKAQPPTTPYNLEEFTDPANYDLEEIPISQARIAFYAALAGGAPGPVLEVACGSGIVALHLARQGHCVTGVDLSRPMLDHARAKAAAAQLPGMRWIEADMRAFDLGGERFGFIFITGHAYQAMLTDDDQRALLACVRRHLAPGGLFAFDTRNPSGHDLSDRPDEEAWFDYADVQGRQVAVSGTQRYDAAAQVMHWTTYRRWHDGKQTRTRVTRIACRFMPAAALAALLGECGFEVVVQYGDFDRTPVKPASPELIMVCRRPDS